MRAASSELEFNAFYHPKPQADYQIDFGNPGGPADRVYAAIALAKSIRRLKGEQANA